MKVEGNASKVSKYNLPPFMCFCLSPLFHTNTPAGNYQYLPNLLTWQNANLCCYGLWIMAVRPPYILCCSPTGCFDLTSFHFMFFSVYFHLSAVFPFLFTHSLSFPPHTLPLLLFPFFSVPYPDNPEHEDVKKRLTEHTVFKWNPIQLSLSLSLALSLWWRDQDVSVYFLTLCQSPSILTYC